MLEKQKIFVGISGGVDSSVAAYLLKQYGHDVEGIFVKTWSPEWLPCTWLDEKRDAMRVCAALDIPFHFLDAEQAYKDGVADYMIAEYKAGRTPNPDVLCNRVIKFGSMWEYAQARGADAIATGHYAQIQSGILAKAADSAKDQSYFLWMLTRDDLDHVYFPIGHLQKSEVRDLAHKAGLFTSTKKDSQGICFLGDVDMRTFLSHYIDETPGDVVTETGVVVGRHDGVLFYTVGERHGFVITEESADRKPYYVIDKDIKHNRLIVSHTLAHTSQSLSQKIRLPDANWLVTTTSEILYTAQIRYHGELISAKIIADDTIELDYDQAIALGQSVVVYDGTMLVGGGVIDFFGS